MRRGAEAWVSEIGIEWLTVLLFGGLRAVAHARPADGVLHRQPRVIFLFVFGNSAVLNMMPSRIFPFMTDYQLSAVPLFIFMAAVLEKAGIIEELTSFINGWGRFMAGLRRPRSSPARCWRRWSASSGRPK